MPLKSLHAKNVCEALLQIWQFTGVCSNISTDLGRNLCCQLMRELQKQMGCTPRFNSPMHPQSTGLAERGVGNVKSIIGKLALEHPTQWHRYLPSVLWALREAVNVTTGLAPWTLVFGRLPRGPLSILKNHWLGTENLPVSFGKSAIEYLRDVQKRLEIAGEYAASHGKIEQDRYQKHYNLRSADKHFEENEEVLVLLPTNTASKLFSTWTGPAKILKKRSPYSYDVELSDGSKRCFHANHLRKFHVRVESVLYDSSVYDVSNCDACNFDGIDVKSCSVMFEDDEDFGYISPVPESRRGLITQVVTSCQAL